MRSKKGELTWDTLIPWIIAIAVLIFIVLLFWMLYGKGSGALDYIQNLFRFK
jgi:hypothetical protein